MQGAWAATEQRWHGRCVGGGSINSRVGRIVGCRSRACVLTRPFPLPPECVRQDETPTFQYDITTRDQVLKLAALAAKWREPPRDALDTLVLGAVDLRWAWCMCIKGVCYGAAVLQVSSRCGAGCRQYEPDTGKCIHD